MNYTENLNLKKPEQEEFYDVDDFNANADILDEVIKNHSDDLTAHKVDPNAHDNLAHYTDQNAHSEVFNKYAKNANVVHISGNEAISGVKTFNSNIVGNLTGNADTATKATQDSDGNQINTTYLPLAGGKMTGTYIARNVNNSLMAIIGGQDTNSGASFMAYGKDSSSGRFLARAHNGSSSVDLIGQANGALTWSNKNIVLSVNNVYADSNGNIDIPDITGNVKTVNGTMADVNGNVNITHVSSSDKATTATKATQDSDGKQINTTYSKNGHTHDDRYYTETEVNNLLAGKVNTSGTYSGLTVGNATKATTADTATNAINCPNYLPLTGGTLTGRLTSNNEIYFKDLNHNWSDTSLDVWVGCGCTVWEDTTGRRMHELIGANGGVWKKVCYINENAYFSVDSNREMDFIGNSLKWNGKDIVTVLEAVNAQNGFFKFDKGLIVQWMYGSWEDATTITLPTAFATTNYGICATDTAPNPEGIAIDSKSTTTFRFRSAVSGARNVHIIAIGY